MEGLIGSFAGMPASEDMMLTVPHPGGPLPFERLAGGGGPPTQRMKKELGLLSASSGTPPSLDVHFPDESYLQALPPHVFKAHELALEAYTAEDARKAIAAAQPGPCPQAYIRFAETAAGTLHAALAFYEDAACEAVRMIELVAPPLLVGTHARLAGLASKPELNGRVVRIEGWSVQKRRFSVSLAGASNPSLSIKPANLEAEDAPPASAAKRLASEFHKRTDDSLWYCKPARPWFRASWFIANDASSSCKDTTKS